MFYTDGELLYDGELYTGFLVKFLQGFLCI